MASVQKEWWFKYVIGSPNGHSPNGYSPNVNSPIVQRVVDLYFAPRKWCCSHLLALQCIWYCLISDIRLLRWQWNFKEKSLRLQTCLKISDKYISVSMINFSTSLRKNPLPGMTKFCATLILLVLIQLHHCLHHEKMKPEEISFLEGKVAQPVKRGDELSLLRFLNSSQMEQPVIYHILN